MLKRTDWQWSAAQPHHLRAHNDDELRGSTLNHDALQGNGWTEYFVRRFIGSKATSSKQCRMRFTRQFHH